MQCIVYKHSKDYQLKTLVEDAKYIIIANHLFAFILDMGTEVCQQFQGGNTFIVKSQSYSHCNFKFDKIQETYYFN
jgi:hypothetical protein